MSATGGARRRWRTVKLRDGRRARVAVVKQPDGTRAVIVKVLRG